MPTLRNLHHVAPTQTLPSGEGLSRPSASSITNMAPGDSLNYYRKDGAHFVPKLQVEDLLF